MKSVRKKFFTLIEVVVALGILGLSLAGLLQLMTQSQVRIAKAVEKWKEMHCLTQGAEYLLLAGDPEDPVVPEDFFPYPEYTIECEVADAEGLPDDYNELDGQLPLKKWTISLLRTSDGTLRNKVVIERFGYEDAENVATK